jgi:hypothetical protein
MPPEQQPLTPYAPEGVAPEATPPAPPVAPFIAQGASEDEKYAAPGWSWGACMFGPMFLIAVRKYAYLWLYLVPVIFLFGTIALWGLLALGQAMSGGSSGMGMMGIMTPILIGIGMLSFFALPIFFGIKGRMLAAESRTFTNRDQYIGFMKVMDHAGKVGFFLTLGFLVLGVVFLGVTQSIVPSGGDGYGGYDEYESMPYDFEELDY